MNDIEFEFTKLVREYRKTIDSEEVNDLFQEVLVNFWNGFAKFRGESSLKTFPLVCLGTLSAGLHRIWRGRVRIFKNVKI